MVTVQVKILDRIFLRTNDIQVVEGVSRSTANKRLQQIRCLLDKKNTEPVTLYDYAAYVNVEVTIICDALSLNYIAA